MEKKTENTIRKIATKLKNSEIYQAIEILQKELDYSNQAIKEGFEVQE